MTRPGNLTGASAGDSYSYDPWGHLTSATLNGVTTTANFDATGARVEVDGVTQLWDRTGIDTLISTGDGDNYLHMPGGILRDDTNWLHGDAVGSIRAVTDNTGTVTATAGYTVFGETRTAASGVFGFAGEQTDPNSLVHLRARDYNPALGTFTSYDPVQPGAPSTAGWNHYTYSANNPTTWTDPTGQAAMSERGLQFLFMAAVAVLLVGAIALMLGDVLVERSRSGASSSTSTQTHDDIDDAVDAETGTNMGLGLTTEESNAIFEEIVEESLQPEPEPEPTVFIPPTSSFGLECDSMPLVDDRRELKGIAEEVNTHWDSLPIHDQTVAALSICVDTPMGPVGGVIVGGQPELVDAQTTHIGAMGGAIVPAIELANYAHAEEQAVTTAELIPNAHLRSIYATNNFCPFCQIYLDGKGFDVNSSDLHYAVHTGG